MCCKSNRTLLLWLGVHLSAVAVVNVPVHNEHALQARGLLQRHTCVRCARVRVRVCVGGQWRSRHSTSTSSAGHASVCAVPPVDYNSTSSPPSRATLGPQQINGQHTCTARAATATLLNRQKPIAPQPSWPVTKAGRASAHARHSHAGTSRKHERSTRHTLRPASEG